MLNPNFALPHKHGLAKPKKGGAKDELNNSSNILAKWVKIREL